MNKYNSLAVMALALSACGTIAPRGDRPLNDYIFGDPTVEDVQYERDAWLKKTQTSKFLKWYQENVISFGPADLEDATYSVEESYARTNAVLESVGMGSLQNCQDHAEGVVELLGRGEVQTLCHVQHGTGNVAWHAVAIVDGYVVDNGAINGYKVFPKDELKHYSVSCDVQQAEAK